MRRFVRFLAALLLLPSLAFGQPPAPPQTHVTLPASNAAFMSNLQDFLRTEDALRFADQFTPFVVSGGLGATAAGLTHTPSALTAYPGGYYATETASITYQNNATCWVIATYTTTAPLVGSFARVPGTKYATDCVSVAEPTLPANAVLLMKVVTAGGAITTVTDLRNLSPTAYRPLALPFSDVAHLPTACRNYQIIQVTDNLRGIWVCFSNAWTPITGQANVTDFGAKADGLTDNTSVVQTALNAFSGSPGIVFIPPNVKWNYRQITHPNEVQIRDYSTYDWDFDQFGGQAVKFLNSTAAPSTKNAHQWDFLAPYHPALILDNTSDPALVSPQASVGFSQRGIFKWQLAKSILASDQHFNINGAIGQIDLSDGVAVSGDQTFTSASAAFVVPTSAADGVTVAADKTFTSASAAFVTADISKRILIKGAGVAGADFYSNIASLNGGPPTTSIELADAPATSVNPATYRYAAGLDDGKPITILGAGTGGRRFTTTISSVTSPNSIELTAAPATSVNPAVFAYGGAQSVVFGITLDDTRFGFGTQPVAQVSEQHTSRHPGNAVWRWASSFTNRDNATQFFAGTDFKWGWTVSAATGDAEFKKPSGGSSATTGVMGATGDLYGFTGHVVTRPNSDNVIESGTVRLSHSTFINTGQGVGTTNTQTLPNAVAGLEYDFIVTTAEVFRIDVQNADAYRGKAVGKYKQSNVLGSWLKARCVIAGTWEWTVLAGTWTDE